ncbi:hypothetical protein [Halosimplex salinum]|uniref:hypothetical protein n=1 Tax=Halosimplex salinum TaxID=1710538 RepID=UPI000F468A3D|nr:hypothetical protein [Halosimplex salinum]
MVNVVAFLVMVFAASAVLGAVALGVTLCFRRAVSYSPRKNEVLPSHYSSLVNTDPSKYPGYCLECGTNNDPDYTVCRNCSSKLPESRYERDKGAANSFLDGK